jgi:hypothetical protein
LAGFLSAIECLYWDHWKTVVFGEVLAGSLLEANFCQLVSAWSVIHFSFNEHCQTVVLGEVLDGSRLKRDFRNSVENRFSIYL